MTDSISVALPKCDVDYLIAAIKTRLLEIGRQYSASGKSYSDDLDIAALIRIAASLGYGISILDGVDEFILAVIPECPKV